MPDIIEETKRIIKLLEDDYLVKLTNDFFMNKIDLIDDIDKNVAELKKNREKLKKNKIYLKYKAQKSEISNYITVLGTYVGLLNSLKSMPQVGNSPVQDSVLTKEHEAELIEALNELKSLLMDLWIDGNTEELKQETKKQVSKLADSYIYSIRKKTEKSESLGMGYLHDLRRNLVISNRKTTNFLTLMDNHICRMKKLSTLLRENEEKKDDEKVNVPIKKEILESNLTARKLKSYFTYFENLQTDYIYLLSKQCYPKIYKCLENVRGLVCEVIKDFKAVTADRIMDLIDKQKQKKESEKLMIEKISNPTLYVLDNLNKNIQKYDQTYNKLLSEGKKLVEAVDEILKKFK